MHQVLFSGLLASLCSVTLASYGGYGGGYGPYNYGYGYSGLAFPYIPYGYHGAKFLNEVKAAKLRGALYDGHPSQYAQFGGHGYVGYPAKTKLDYSLNGIPNAGYGPGPGPSFFDGRSNVAAADSSRSEVGAAVAPVAADDVRAGGSGGGGVEAPLVDSIDNTNGGGGGSSGAANALYAANNNIGVIPPYATIPQGRTNAYALDKATALSGEGVDPNSMANVVLSEQQQLQPQQQQPLQRRQAPMGGGYGGKVDPYALYARYMGPYGGGYSAQKTAFGPSGQAYY